MTLADFKGAYYQLVVLATDLATDIWLVDDHWHPVQKATGMLDTSVLAGRYGLEFDSPGLEGLAYPVELVRDLQLTQRDLEAGPSCPRQPPELLDEE